MLTKREGLTLIELLVLIILLAVLFAVVVRGVRKTRRVEANYQHINNLKQVALACHSANDVHRRLPPAYGLLGASPAGQQSIHYYLLPFAEMDNLYKAYVASALVPPYTAPNDSSVNDFAGVQNFAANLRVFSDKGLATPYNANIDFGNPRDPSTWDSGFGKSRIPATFEPRGTAYTILFATRFANNTSRGIRTGAPNCSAHAGRPYHENGAFFGTVAALAIANADTSVTPTFQLWPTTDMVECSTSSFAHSFGSKALYVALGDASLRGISPSISPEIWNRAMQPNTDLVLGENWNE
jgi:type II secretory pathway pseudopilin PulG